MTQINIILFLSSLVACIYLVFEEDKYLIIVSEPFATFGPYGILLVLLIPLLGIFYNDLISRYSDHFSLIALKSSDLFRFILTIVSAGISFGFIRLLRMETMSLDEINLNWFVKIRRKWNFDELKTYARKWLEFKDIKFTNGELNSLVNSNTTKSIKELNKLLDEFLEQKSKVPSNWSVLFSHVTQFAVNNAGYILAGVCIFVALWKVTSWFDFSFFGLFGKDPEPLNRVMNDNSTAFVSLDRAVNDHGMKLNQLSTELGSLVSEFAAFSGLFHCIGDDPGKRIKDLQDHVRNLASMISMDRRAFKSMFPFTVEQMNYFKPFMHHTIKTCMSVAEAGGGFRRFPGFGRSLGRSIDIVNNESN